MIKVKDGHKAKLSFSGATNSFDIYTYERIILNQSEYKLIILPYFRENIGKFFNFQLNIDLITRGLRCEWNNLNEESSKNHLTFFLTNTIIRNNTNISHLNLIIQKDKIDIKSGELLGKIYI